MRILIAVDKFKGSLTGPEAAVALASGLDGHTIDIVPVADGGEGTVDAAVAAGFGRRRARVCGPAGDIVDAGYAVRGGVAVIEMAAASGLDLLPAGRLAPLTATSRGTGELIRAALDDGCRRIVLGVGGSACTDGGAGMLAALGARLTDDEHDTIEDGGGALGRLSSVDLTGLDQRLRGTELVLASDVDNPLLGERGAATVFAPQKGAAGDDVAVLEAGLARFVRVLQTVRPDAARLAARPGAGAAGGVGYAALLLGARTEPGTDVVQHLTRLTEHIARAHLVITGEGSLDEQSLGGKAPIGVARAAARAGVPVVAVCGRTTLTDDELRAAGFAAVYPLTDIEPDVRRCIRDAARLLRRVGTAIGAADDLIAEASAETAASATANAPTEPAA
jgi:glycerate kinase